MNEWDVSNVNNMKGMFMKVTNFNQDISKCNTEKSTDMSRMFFEAKEFNQNLSGCVLSSIPSYQNKSYMFAGADKVNTNPSQKPPM